MAKFDFIAASARGYEFTASHFAVLARLCVVPLVLKILAFAVIFYFGIEENLLRSGLVMLPSHFALGWVLAVTIRWAMVDEKIGNVSGMRLYALGGGMISFVLIKMVLGGFLGLLLGGGFIPNPVSGAEGVTPAEPNALLSLFLIGVLVAMFLSIRFVWIYVPISMGVRPRDYLRRTRAFATAFPILGAWLVCSVPVLLVGFVVMGFALSAFSLEAEQAGPAFYAVTSIIQSISDIVTSLICSVAIAYGLREILSKEAK